MVQFRILSGKKAGATWVARRFPVRVGRAPDCDLQLAEQGVWNEHFRVEFHPGAGFVLETFPEAIVTANGLPVQRTVLHNGDTLEIGALKLRFWLNEARQRSLRISEALVWSVIIVVTLGQVALAYWLPH